MTTINIATDVTVSPESLGKTSWKGLQKIARQGSAQQIDCLLTWAYGSIPADMSEHLQKIAEGRA